MAKRKMKIVVKKESVVKLVIPISLAEGMLRGMESKPTRVVIKEVKKGWKSHLLCTHG